MPLSTAMKGISYPCSMKLKVLTAALISCTLIFQSCHHVEEIAKQAAQLGPPTNSEIIQGLKEALKVGITNAVGLSSKKDGFLGNNLIRIPVPKEAENVMKTLRDLGMNGLVNDFETSLNRAAEEASKSATDIFVSAITKMTFDDAVKIWKGDNDAATQYLRRTTGSQLLSAFDPITRKAVESTQVTKYWGDITNVYNKIPGVKAVNPNLNEYVNNQAMDGLFKMVALEEKNIRENPSARVNDILKRVFGYQG